MAIIKKKTIRKSLKKAEKGFESIRKTVRKKNKDLKKTFKKVTNSIPLLRKPTLTDRIKDAVLPAKHKKPWSNMLKELDLVGPIDLLCFVISYFNMARLITNVSIKFTDFIYIAIQVHKRIRERGESQKINNINLIHDRSIYYEAALIASDVYDDNSSVLNLINWERSEDFPNIEYNNDTGLVSRLYSKKGIDHTDYIYATSGTINFEDWKNNVEQLYTDAPQYESALYVANRLNELICAPDTLMFVGHSLGGGLAANNALNIGKRAIVFNPAALSTHTLNKIENKLDANIEVIITTNDLLNWLQDTAKEAFGLDLQIPGKTDDKHYFSDLGNNPIQCHKMSSLLDVIKHYQESQC